MATFEASAWFLAVFVVLFILALWVIMVISCIVREVRQWRKYSGRL
jgi:hypothetical protein